MTDFGPYLEFVRIQTEMNKLFESLQELRETRSGDDTAAAGWMPNVDIREAEDAVVVEAEVPGVDPPSLQVRVGGGNLTLEGTKLKEPEREAVAYHRRDRSHGRFRRVVPLTVPVNTHQARAELENGLLRVRFPKVPNKRGEEVRIPVKFVEADHA